MDQKTKIRALQVLCGHDPDKLSATASAINWAALLALVEQIVPAIWPFILPLLTPTPPTP